ncbi:NapC/NirT family cytochrome c [Endozoicomonas sp.]|uniref:NapC/NirT family cytochrome c n=1 Tax=Endozoicomonas sp. TaxID=1892382 RepID=UPI003839FA55
MKIKKWVGFLRKPSGTLSVGFLIVAGVVAGLLLKTGFDTSLSVTSSDEFCTSCHEMASSKDTASYIGC